jgi:EPS-associated MarR family transcriptional regulator
LNEEVQYRLLRTLSERPDATQRQLAHALGISLGKANYCLRALLEKGWLKARNSKNSNNKRAYSYLLTPAGVDAKACITARFLKRKLAEYEALEAEIARLTDEVKRLERGSREAADGA